MDIFSKRDGARQEDVRAKRLISENAPVIRRLADQISNGGFSRMRAEQAARREEPKPDGLIIHDLKARPASDAPAPYVRVSVNNRVVLADSNNGRQLQLLGELRGNFMGRTFVPATSENGFISPIDDEIRAAIADLDGVAITPDFSEKDLAAALEERLGLT
ncbi:hypothetical protein HKCCE2091_16540 [Rhodobacterales bacterium HKCCE2091]|nr:hypothetical protein [Rhodobacterales bacterium HKCCE2091]